jgi:hypothetical protein
MDKLRNDLGLEGIELRADIHHGQAAVLTRQG